MENTNNGNTSDAKGSPLTLPPDKGERKRGRPKGTGTNSGGTAVSDKQEGANPELLDALYKAELWGDVAALPFNIRKAFSGSEIHTVTSKQKEILGLSLSTVLKGYGVLNPRDAALIVLLVNMGTMFAEMEIRYRLSLPKKSDDKPFECGSIEGGGFNI